MLTERERAGNIFHSFRKPGTTTENIAMYTLVWGHFYQKDAVMKNEHVKSKQN